MSPNEGKGTPEQPWYGPLNKTAVDDWVFQQGDRISAGSLFVFGTGHHIYQFAIRMHDLWRYLGLRHIIISGHQGEAEKLAIAAHHLGVPSSLFTLERKASNTRDNVILCGDLFREIATSQQLHVLAKLYSAPRCLLTLRHQFPSWQFQLHTVDWLDVNRKNWANNPVFCRKLVSETQKIVNYAAKGDIASPSAPFDSHTLLQLSSALSNKASQHSQPVNPPEKKDPSVKEKDNVFINDVQLVTIEAHLDQTGDPTVLNTTLVQRPNAIAVLAYDDRLDKVVLVKQFRAGPFLSSGSMALEEVVAGYIDAGETEVLAAQRELQEETGLVPHHLIPITSFSPAPTLSTERVSLWLGFVDTTQCAIHIANGVERIHVVQYSGDEIDQMVVDGCVSNALTLLALQWLVKARPVLMATRPA